MTKKTINVGRRLNEKPFLEVSIVPGEYSEPSLLNYTVSTEWPDSRSINIDVAFDQPPAVSSI